MVWRCSYFRSTFHIKEMIKLKLIYMGYSINKIFFFRSTNSGTLVATKRSSGMLRNFFSVFLGCPSKYYLVIGLTSPSEFVIMLKTRGHVFMWSSAGLPDFCSFDRLLQWLLRWNDILPIFTSIHVRRQNDDIYLSQFVIKFKTSKYEADMFD